MNRGYWKFWRKTVDSHLFAFPLQFTLWCYLLNEASHNHHTYPDGTKIVPGDLITSRAKLAVACGMSEQSVRTNLTRLKSSGRITINATSRHTKVTIVNWVDYQAETPRANQRTNQRSTSDQPAPNQRLTTTKNSNSNSNSKPKEEEPVAAAATRKADREAKDHEKLKAWNTWKGTIRNQASNGDAPAAALYLDRLEDAVDRFYADHGGTFTPTRKAALARRLAGAKLEPLLSAVEVYVDRYAGMKDERYFYGIAKKNGQLSGTELDTDIDRHRLQFKGRGIFSEV